MAKRDAPEINAGSMADIAFLLLVFFLVTTTMDSDLGMMRKLPPTLPPDMPKPPPIKDRNVFVVLANANDQLLVEGELMDITELKEAAKEFIENPMNKETLPEKKQVDVPLFGPTMVSKQVISLQNANDDFFSSFHWYWSHSSRANLFIQQSNNACWRYGHCSRKSRYGSYGGIFINTRNIY